MTAKRKPLASPTITARAKQVLAYAQEKARTCKYSNDLLNAIFSDTGKATELFPSEAERTAFLRTAQGKSIYKLIHALPDPPIKGAMNFQSNGNFAITVRVPKSLHEALTAEATAEGVSLDQLCLTKLVAQLRDLV